MTRFENTLEKKRDTYVYIAGSASLPEYLFSTVWGVGRILSQRPGKGCVSGCYVHLVRRHDGTLTMSNTGYCRSVRIY